MKRPFFLALSLLALPWGLQAQNPSSRGEGEETGLPGFWEVVTDGGRFLVRLDKITSVSEQEYLIDGAVRVYECTVDTNGSQTARFYYLEPPVAAPGLTTAVTDRVRNLASQAADRAEVADPETLVTKHYPDTTHAKTSEYRVADRATVSRIYDHLRRVWGDGQGRAGGNLLMLRQR